MRNAINTSVLIPVSRLGRIPYARSITGYEILRPNYVGGKEKAEFKRAIGEQNGASPEEEGRCGPSL